MWPRRQIGQIPTFRERRLSGFEPLIPLRLLTLTYASVTKDAATQRGAMRTSDTCACNPVRHKPTRRGPATGPVALRTSPYISMPFRLLGAQVVGAKFRNNISFHNSPCCANVTRIPINVVSEDLSGLSRGKA